MQVHPKDTGDDVIALIDDRVIGAADEKDIKQHAHASQPTDGLKSPRHGPGTLTIVYRVTDHAFIAVFCHSLTVLLPAYLQHLVAERMNEVIPAGKLTALGTSNDMDV